MKVHPISCNIETVQDSDKPEVRLLFSCLVRDVRMSANEAEWHAYKILDEVKKARKLEKPE